MIMIIYIDQRITIRGVNVLFMEKSNSNKIKMNDFLFHHFSPGPDGIQVEIRSFMVPSVLSLLSLITTKNN